MGKHIIKIYLIFLLLPLQVLGQNITFTLYSYNPCTRKINKIKFFGLKNGDKVFSVDDTSGVLNLKKIGVYSLSYVIDMIDSSQLGKEYNIKTAGNYSDTLRLMTIISCLEPISSPNFIGYCCCNKKCEGQQVDYYANGNKRIEGFFKKGRPVGELNFYYPTGQLKLIEKYNKRGKLLKKTQYDKNGNLINFNNR